MTDTVKANSRSTDVHNAERLYNSLSPSDRNLIDAMMSMAFVLFKSVQQVKCNESSDYKT